MLKKILGVFLVLLSLSSFSVSALAFFEKPIPILGPLVGYDPEAADETDVSDEDLDAFQDLGGESSASDSSSSSDASSETEKDPFDFPAAGSSSEATSSEAVINPDDENSTAQPNGSATNTAMTSFMKKLEAVSVSEMFASQYKFATTDMTDPATCYLNFPNDASFTVTESKGTGIIKVETEVIIRSTVSADELDMVYGKEALLQVIYEAISQARGLDVGKGAEEFKTLVGDKKLLVIPTPATIAGVKETLKVGTIDNNKFTIEVQGVQFAEFGATAQLSMTFKEPTTPVSTSASEADTGSSKAEIAPGTGPSKLSPPSGNQ